MVESVADPNTANWGGGPGDLPASWGIGLRGGLSYTTTYQVDALGRTTRETDPDGNITYTVYNDVEHEVCVFPGWEASTDTTTGPVEVYREDSSGTYTETLTYTWNGPNGMPTGADGVPLGSLWLDSSQVTIESLSRTLFNDAGQDVADLQYTNLAGLVYSTTPILGTKGVDYQETDNAYGPWGELTSVTDPLGHTTTYAYDANGNLIATTDPLGNTTRSVYNNVNQLASVTDADGNTTTFTYDMFGNVASQTNALGDTTSYVYDDLGNLLSSTDADGRTTAYQYNAQNEETAENWLDASGNATYTISYAYDADGNLTGVSDPAATYTYTYDGAGRTTSETDTIAGLAPTIVLAGQYDADGNRTEGAATIGGTADFVNQYAYDAAGRLATMTQAGVAGGDAVAEKRIDFTYDAAGYTGTITRYADLAGSQLVVQSTYGYDAAGDVTSLVHAQGSTVLAGYTWSYDAAGNLVQETSTADGTANYSYDATGQLTGATYTGTRAGESFSYDATGNSTNAGCVTGPNNQLLSDGTFTYTYDADGNCTSKTRISNAPADDYRTLYTWDYHNRLTSVTFEDNSSNVTKTVSYTYDAFDRMVGKTVSVPGQADQKTVFVYDGTQAVLQFDASGSGPLTAANLSHRYLWNPQAVDQLFADEQLPSPSTGEGQGEGASQPGQVLWTLGDNQGTVRDIATYNAQTGVTAIANHLVYGAFGNIVSQTNTSVQCAIGYTGCYRDPDTGLQLHGVRWYDPAAQRWLSQDPSGFAGGDVNLYRYVTNDAPAEDDPLGLAADPKGPDPGGLQGPILIPPGVGGPTTPKPSPSPKPGNPPPSPSPPKKDKHPNCPGPANGPNFPGPFQPPPQAPPWPGWPFQPPPQPPLPPGVPPPPPWWNPWAPWPPPWWKPGMKLPPNPFLPPPADPPPWII